MDVRSGHSWLRQEKYDTGVREQILVKAPQHLSEAQNRLYMEQDQMSRGPTGIALCHY